MSGHSKWSTIKHKKGVADAKRGALFTKLAKAISIAARDGGGDPEFNFQLRSAIDLARAANVPKDNIARSIKRGTGEIDGGVIEEVLYEGYGPGGVAVLVQTLTDNRNRTASNIKHIFTKHGGNLGGSGAVQWMFDQKGIVRIPGSKEPDDGQQLLLIDAGAEDIEVSDSEIIISSPGNSLAKVRDAAESAGFTVASSDLEWVAKDTVDVDEDVKGQLEKMFEEMDGDEDAHGIFFNVQF